MPELPRLRIPEIVKRNVPEPVKAKAREWTEAGKEWLRRLRSRAEENPPEVLGEVAEAPEYKEELITEPEVQKLSEPEEGFTAETKTGDLSKPEEETANIWKIETDRAQAFREKVKQANGTATILVHTLHLGVERAHLLRESNISWPDYLKNVWLVEQGQIAKPSIGSPTISLDDDNTLDKMRLDDEGHQLRVSTFNDDPTPNFGNEVQRDSTEYAERAGKNWDTFASRLKEFGIIRVKLAGTQLSFGPSLISDPDHVGVNGDYLKQLEEDYRREMKLDIKNDVPIGCVGRTAMELVRRGIDIEFIPGMTAPFSPETKPVTTPN